MIKSFFERTKQKIREAYRQKIDPIKEELKPYLNEEEFHKVELLIHAAAGSAAAASGAMAQGAILGLDTPVLISLHIGMIISLGEIFGKRITKAGAAAILSAATGVGVKAIMGIIPVGGNAVNAVVSFGYTEFIGWASVRYFFTGEDALKPALAVELQGEPLTGDTYTIHNGQVGAIGKNANAGENIFHNTEVKGDITMSADKQILGDNFESGGGAMNIAKDHGTATQTNYTVTAQGSSGDLLTLLDTVRRELAALPVDESVKEEVLNEVKGAEIQAKKPEPDTQKIAVKLKDATVALEESAKTVKGAVAIGNLLGQAITWCGEQWITWG